MLKKARGLGSSARSEPKARGLTEGKTGSIAIAMEVLKMHHCYHHLLLVAFLLLVVRPGAPSSILASSSDALCSSVLAPTITWREILKLILKNDTGPSLGAPRVGAAGYMCLGSQWRR